MTTEKQWLARDISSNLVSDLARETKSPHRISVQLILERLWRSSRSLEVAAALLGGSDGNGTPSGDIGRRRRRQ